jgi:carbohydrate ABC transporter substrate-binding protein, CUT1 family (TC 3.A.1.1.-)
MRKKKYWIGAVVVCIVLIGAGGYQNLKKGEEKEEKPMLSVEMQAQWETAESTPLGKYPETVTYTLGKIAGANNANLPAGNTYEDNAYTRYLREVLNIQNDDVFELEAGGPYEEALEMAIEDRNIPDILVVNGRDNLIRLVENDMVEDLTDVYKNCTTKVIKEMYDSYGENVLASATFDGRLYAFPNTEIDDGEMLLWLRQDWIQRLEVEEPKSLEEAMYVIRKFVETDIAGNGSTVGLACSTNLIAGSSDTYGVDGIFSNFGSIPETWILDETGKVVYGSLTPETKQALAYLNKLYTDGILDSRFLLREPENINRLVVEGKCGAVFGRWWAPNNPLSAAYSADNTAVWKPYLFSYENDKKVQVFESYDDSMYVVVRKGFEHPEIVGKYVSALFDYARYGDDQYADEVNEYFGLNVDPTARPMNINVDYYDGLYRSGENIRKALEGEKAVEELSGLEKSYYNTCVAFLEGDDPSATDWAAYASRIEAVEVLVDANV